MVRLNAYLVILFISSQASAQSGPVTWQSESVTDMRSNEETPFTCEFIIYPNDRIEWVQGQYTESYSIASGAGDLPQEGPGTLVYDVTKDGVAGKVTIQRVENGDVTLTLDLSEGTQLGAYFSFKVSNP